MRKHENCRSEEAHRRITELAPPAAGVRHQPAKSETAVQLRPSRLGPIHRCADARGTTDASRESICVRAGVSRQPWATGSCNRVAIRGLKRKQARQRLAGSPKKSCTTVFAGSPWPDDAAHANPAPAPAPAPAAAAVSGAVGEPGQPRACSHARTSRSSAAASHTASLQGRRSR